MYIMINQFNGMSNKLENTSFIFNSYQGPNKIDLTQLLGKNKFENFMSRIFILKLLVIVMSSIGIFYNVLNIYHFIPIIISWLLKSKKKFDDKHEILFGLTEIKLFYKTFQAFYMLYFCQFIYLIYFLGYVLISNVKEWKQ